MDSTSKLIHIDLRSTFFNSTPLSDLRTPSFRPRIRPISTPITNCSTKPPYNSNNSHSYHPIRLSSVSAATETSAVTNLDENDIESLFSNDSSETANHGRGSRRSGSGGASSISSGVRLENVSKSYKGVTVLKDVSWEVKKGEKVGLVGVNGAGKTTQLRIISGMEEPDSGNVVKAKSNMRISFLSQEFEVSMGRTVREEFMHAFKEEMEVSSRLEKVRDAIEGSVDDLELMGRLLDEFDLLQRRAQAVDLDSVDVKVNKLMPELGFCSEDADRLVASFSGGWQMRMSLGKILLQKLEKLQEEEQVDKPFIRKQMKIRFPERGKSGRDVVTIKNLDFSYEDKVLFKKANIIIERGEKIAIIGPNGCGKSTLLKLIMGIQKPDSGEVILGEHNVLPNYFEQNQAEALDLEKTVLDTVAEVAEDWRIDDIMGLLGRCNFKADMLDRKVSLLSGGEKARLAFCKFMVKPSTLLVLDEPTNHLDIPSKEMLEEAISEYEGTVITVSHDRYFIKQIVNRVLEVKDGNLQDYNGDYDYYLEKNLEAREKALVREAELEDKSSKAKAKSKMSKAEREARKKQKMQAFQQAKQKSKGLKNSKRWN
ncbi:hypothetical protein SSX86_011321 [Deinandra increscens subsp. villosa]|uniref:ABC transporter domain-containing protein n=1 Tax=Deinandra increscens subsp. villosa TaxID=3103831 RepID=A0AAP0GZT1_9ASTR